MEKAQAAAGAGVAGPETRLWVSALVALAVAIVSNLLVRAVGLAALDVPADFPPLAIPGPTVFFTTIGVLGATAVFALLRRFSTRPDEVFRRVAAVVLVLSFVPDLMLLTEGAGDAFPGATPPGVAVLMLMHVVAAAVIVWAFTMRGRPPSSV